jgi:hypothetical protein
MAQKNTATIVGPTFTPLSTVTPFNLPTIFMTPTRESSSANFSPKNTQKPSLYQEIRKLPKGSYILLMGRNGNNANYAYVLITEKGEIVKKFILSEYVLGFSNDLRYFVYQSSLPNNIKWGDMNDERTKIGRAHV